MIINNFIFYNVLLLRNIIDLTQLSKYYYVPIIPDLNYDK